ncbi:pre-mRNA splicing factor, putative [Entamoeba invadens IP1]|uniref:Pre-mRNA splicing factor, putative n=1 Tax=Entamoeba invadens IP1 TaxID=370355 RepID=A0A0A1TUI9_ENTIV|nr:pre-mRNA splicing factor, putative [Entamoeba invadens IP1]ELP83694.1 pre-mRNA splicing factor, putative [Entamoeba invadens IP1]|eukprot:XP_004183040.1 pre-mRNA splicing factor, putative [Entamoeba invadens IP1]
MSKKLDFLNMEGPKGYVAGSLRGDTGFITLNDIGPARTFLPNEPFDSAPEEDSTQQDMEAEKIYSMLDARLSSRRKARREAREKQENAKYEKTHPKLLQQFSDLKAPMKTISMEEWKSIPDVVGRKRRGVQVNEFLEGRHMPVPDKVLVSEYLKSTPVGTIVPDDDEKDKFETPLKASRLYQTDLNEEGSVRTKTLQIKLDGSKTSVSKVNVNGYLTELGTTPTMNMNDAGNIKQYRELFKAMRKNNPKSSAGWVQGALVEESLGQISQALKIIMEGTIACSKSEEVWLHAIRLSPDDMKADVCARGISILPKTPALWLEAIELERKDSEKRKISIKAVEVVPKSLKLWEKAISLEEGENKLNLMKQAVEALPSNVELWIIYAENSTYEQSKKIMNQCLKVLPKEPRVWIYSAVIEEVKGKDIDRSNKVIKKGIKYFDQQKIQIENEVWISNAEKSRKEAPNVLKSVVESLLERYSDVADGIKSSRECIKCEETEELMNEFWIQHNGGKSVLDDVLRTKGNDEDYVLQLIQNIVNKQKEDITESMWSTLIAWAETKTNTTYDTLIEQARKSNGSGGERANLSLIRRLKKKQLKEQALQIIDEALNTSKGHLSMKILKEGIKISSELNLYDKEDKYLHIGEVLDPQDDYIWERKLIREARVGNEASIRKLYQSAMDNKVRGTRVWEWAGCFEERRGDVGRARRIFEDGVSNNRMCAEMWLSHIYFEERVNPKKDVQSLLSNALKSCKENGKIWREIIERQPSNMKQGYCKSALKEFESKSNEGDYCQVVLAAGVLLYQTGKKEQARKWFEKTVFLDKNFGDGWVWLYKTVFDLNSIKLKGTNEPQSVIERCVIVGKKYGKVWKRLKDNTLSDEEILKKGIIELN